MKKMLRKLIPALIMMLVAASLVGTATYAWFSMNTKVTVTGMNVSTHVGSNLTISTTNADLASYNSYGLNQDVTGILEPVSTINGQSFFYTNSFNVNGDGSAKSNSYMAYVAGDDFDRNYGLTSDNGTADAFGYKDYEFYIQATNAASSEMKLAMTRCNLTYAGGALGSETAWRVAVFATPATLKTPITVDAAAVQSNLVTILAPTGADYFTKVSTVNQGVSATNAKADVVKLGTAATLSTLNANSTSYYRVVVRMWLEGEDVSCNNTTFANLTKDYRLDLEFQIQADDGVTAIESTGAVGITKAAQLASVTLTEDKYISNGEEAASYAWYTAADNAVIAGATASNYTNTDTAATKAVYCIVTTTRGSQYRSNTIAVDAE